MRPTPRVIFVAAFALLAAMLAVPPGALGQPLPDLSINNVTVTEGDAGTEDATFTITLSEESDDVVTVDFDTEEGTADSPSDFEDESGTVEFDPGDTSETITIQVVGDTRNEPNETFFVQLSDAVNADIDDGTGTGTIRDDDGPGGGPGGEPGLSIDDVSVTEGDSGTRDAVFTVSLSDPTDVDVTVDFETVEGTADTPSDFEDESGTLTIDEGDDEETISIEVVGDTRDEPTETFLVELSDAVNADIDDGTGTGRILDDDGEEEEGREDCDIVGTAGNDHLEGGPRGEVICGLGGNDTIEGGGGDDVLRGGSGSDNLDGEEGDDVLRGRTGGDDLFDHEGNDLLRGGPDADNLDADDGRPRDTLRGGRGRDNCDADPGDTVRGC